MVDDEDFDRLNKYKWHVKVSGIRYYACRSVKNKKGVYDEKVMLSHEVLSIYGRNVYHLDGNRLNCQKSNLALSKWSMQEGTNLGKLVGSSHRWAVHVLLDDDSYSKLTRLAEDLGNTPSKIIERIIQNMIWPPPLKNGTPEQPSGYRYNESLT